MPSGQFYKIKLASGRILGPLDLERVRLLVLKNQVVGTELARFYPTGEWQDINLIPEIAELLVARVDGSLEKDPSSRSSGYAPIGPGPAEGGSTQVLQGAEGGAPLGNQSLSTAPDLPSLMTGSAGAAAGGDLPPVPGSATSSVELSSQDESDGKTVVTTLEDDDERTRLVTRGSMNMPPLELEGHPAPGDDDRHEGEQDREDLGLSPYERNIANERTVVFQRSTDAPTLPGKRKAGPKELLKGVVVVLALAMAGQELFLTQDSPKGPVKAAVVRARLPSYIQGKSDPQASQKLYVEAMKHYVADTVAGYTAAAERLLLSASHDITNVKALAMLASCYLNLIDSSNKDENYFSVISKLIELSRAKAVDLPETVIADVEFFVTVNKAEAAQNRIVEYTKTHQFGLEMFYYLAYAFYSRGDAQNAARYAGQIPDNKAFSAKVFYLRGRIADKLNDTDTALQEYRKAVQFNPEHARSRLRMAELLAKKGTLKEAAPYLEFLVTRPRLLPPKELALAYYYHAQLNQLFQKWDLALGDIERAVRLDRGNSDYLLELYTLRAKAGDSIQAVQKEARMYYFLSEGEKLLRQGKYQEALTQFLQARQSNEGSPIPLVRIGDMFSNLHDIGNARLNYKLAAARAPNSIEIWSKYIDVLIQSYEWDEAEKAMAKFRSLPVSQSAIDKAAGDMYARQNRHVEAQMFYKKAMARDSIDPDVYISFAKSLMATRNYKDAPFFFALALRFDPTSSDALIGTAKAVAASESIDRGISLIQDELTKGTGSRAELLAAIAEFQIQKGEWSIAQRYVDQAMAADPDYAYPWKLQAQIYMNREGLDRDALDRALAAYKSYSDRNGSDPSGYLERYRVFAKKSEFQKAEEELDRIFSLYPKYPNLHYYKGKLYDVMGNHKLAAAEFESELKNNPGGWNTMVELGKQKLELGQVREALELFNKAMQIVPTQPEPKLESGYANYLLKNYQGAVALFNAALLYDKGNPLIYKRLGMAYRDMGDGVGAKNAFKKYLEMEPDAPDRAEFERFL